MIAAVRDRSFGRLLGAMQGDKSMKGQNVQRIGRRKQYPMQCALLAMLAGIGRGGGRTVVEMRRPTVGCTDSLATKGLDRYWGPDIERTVCDWATVTPRPSVFSIIDCSSFGQIYPDP